VLAQRLPQQHARPVGPDLHVRDADPDAAGDLGLGALAQPEQEHLAVAAVDPVQRPRHRARELARGHLLLRRRARIGGVPRDRPLAR
jgi:hypothetical protein